MSDIDPVFVGILASVVTGGIGLFMGHYLTKDRDAITRQSILERESEIRRREFRRIIARYRSRIERPFTPDHAPEEPWPVFNMALTDIIAEAAMCENDFPDRKALDDAIRSATDLRKDDTERHMNQTQTPMRTILSDELARILKATN